MKYILSLFAVLHTGLSFSAAAAATVSFPPVSLNTSIYPLSVHESTWSVKWKPSNVFSLYAGNLSFGGLWTSFSSPCPPFPNALKQKESGKTAFITKTADKGLFPLSGAAEWVIPGGKITGFASCEKREQKGAAADYRVQAGAGAVFPFSIQSVKEGGIKKPDISGYWAAAWKITYTDFPQSKQWFTPAAPFKSFYSNGIIQQFMLQGTAWRFSVENGWAENPYGKPAFFINGSLFQRAGVFSYNTGFFFCTKNYLKQNGDFEKKRFQSFLNPQLEFTFPSSLLRELQFGISGEVFYEQTWTFSGKGAFRAETAICDFKAGIRLPRFDTETNGNSGALHIQKGSMLELNADLNIKPPYAKTFKHKWTIGADCALLPQNRTGRKLKSYAFNSGCTAFFTLAGKLRCSVSAGAQVQFPDAATAVKTGVRVVLPYKKASVSVPAVLHKVQIGISGNAELTLKKTDLKKIAGRLVVSLKYN